MAPKLKEDSYGKLFATERLEVSIPHPDGYELAFSFNEGEEVPRDIAEKAGVLKKEKPSSKASKGRQPAAGESKDAREPKEPTTVKMPAPRRRAGKAK